MLETRDRKSFIGKAACQKLMFGDTIGEEPQELILQPYSSPSSDLMLVPPVRQRTQLGARKPGAFVYHPYESIIQLWGTRQDT